MITMSQFMQAVGCRITGGAEYQWGCFGPHAQFLESEVVDNAGESGHSVQVVFDRQTQVVYEMQAWDDAKRRAYRWIHPDFLAAFEAEGKARGVDNGQACDDQRFVDIEDPADILEKATAIASGAEYDTRIGVPIELEDAEIFALMKIAHERDITLNELVGEILQEVIDQKSVETARAASEKEAKDELAASKSKAKAGKAKAVSKEKAKPKSKAKKGAKAK